MKIDTRAYAERTYGAEEVTDIMDHGNLMCGSMATKNSGHMNRAVRKSLYSQVEENSPEPRRRYPNQQCGGIAVKIIMTILQIIMVMATCGWLWWQGSLDDILDLASDTIMETNSVEIDNMLCNTSLQQIPVWRRKMVNLRHYGYNDSYVLLLVDSGAFRHVCPPDFGKGLTPTKGQNVVGAGGEKISHYGERIVGVRTDDGVPADIQFLVCDVRRPILSVGNLSKMGIRVYFDVDDPHIRWQGRRYNLIYMNNLFYWPMRLRRGDQVISTSSRKYCEACGAILYEGKVCPYPTCISHKQTKSTSQTVMNKTPDDEWQRQVECYGEVLANGEGQSESTKDIKAKQFPPDDEYDDEQGIPVKVGKDLRIPDEEEQRNHKTTHLPYRAWCPLCVKGRGRDRQHLRMDHRADTQHDNIPRLEIDYSYIKLHEDEKVKPILIACYAQEHYGLAAQLTAKGRQDPRAAMLLYQFLQECGLHGRIIVRTDEEQAAISIAEDLAGLRGKETTLLETVPKRSCASIGHADQFAQSVLGLTRTLCLSIQERWKCKLTVDSPIIPWAVRHSAWLLNRYRGFRKADGQTPFQRIHGRQYGAEIFNFTQPVVGRIAEALELPKLQARWMEGIWLGKSPDTDAHIIGTPKGIIGTRTCQTLAVHADLMKPMIWTPWKLNHPTTKRPPIEPKSDDEPDEKPDKPQREPPILQEPPAKKTYVPRGDVPRQQACPTPTRHFSGEDTEATKRCRRFQQECGLTPGCKRCHDRDQNSHHSAFCKKRRHYWDQHQRTAEEDIEVDKPEKKRHAEDLGHGKTKQWHHRGEKRERDQEAEAEQEREHRQDLQDRDTNEVSRVQRKGPWYDTDTGEELDDKLVEEGMEAEMQSFKKLQVYRKATKDDYLKDLKDGKKPQIIKTGWVLRKKVRNKKTIVRARCVATQVSDRSNMDEYYTPTPRHVAHRIVMARALEKKWQVHTGDVETAFLNAWLDPDEPPIYLIPPTETCNSNELWFAQKWTYGLRKSPKGFNKFFAKAVKIKQWVRVTGEPQLFHNPRFPGAIMSVHTDDLLFTADPKDVAKIKDELGSLMSIRWEGAFGSEWKKFLGFEWKHVKDEIMCRVPLSYYENMLSDWKMERCKPALNPFSQAMLHPPEDSPNVDEQTHSRYRRTVGQLLDTSCETIFSTHQQRTFQRKFCTKDLPCHRSEAHAQVHPAYQV